MPSTHISILSPLYTSDIYSMYSLMTSICLASGWIVCMSRNAVTHIETRFKFCHHGLKLLFRLLGKYFKAVSYSWNSHLTFVVVSFTSMLLFEWTCLCQSSFHLFLNEPCWLCVNVICAFSPFTFGVSLPSCETLGCLISCTAASVHAFIFQRIF